MEAQFYLNIFIAAICQLLKNKRTPNFTDFEESVLLCLVKEHAGIWENKKTDAIRNTEKNRAWTAIEQEYNVQTGQVNRNATVLKKYENLKKKERKENMQMKATDGILEEEICK